MITKRVAQTTEVFPLPLLEAGSLEGRCLQGCSWLLVEGVSDLGLHHFRLCLLDTLPVPLGCSRTSMMISVQGLHYNL